MLRFLSLLAVAAIAASAQTVEGSVIDVATGSGIASAKVVLHQGDEAPYSATAGADGQFRIEGLKPGTYSVRYSAEHYFFPGGGPRDPAPIHITAGGGPVRIEGRMVALSRIGGRVIDGHGDPVVNARIDLTTLTSFWAAQTDAKGNFDLDFLAPGNTNATLAISAPSDWKAPAPDPETHESRAWARTWYPGVLYRDQAAPIILRSGGKLLGLEIKLLAAPLHALSGVLLDPDGAPAPRATLTLWEAGPRRDAAYRAESQADGSFVFPRVIDGDWRLSAEFEMRGVPLRAREWIQLKGGDIDGIRLRLSPPFTLSGKVLIDSGKQTATPAPPDVLLIKQHNGEILLEGQSIYNAEPGADGRFQFGNLYPGTYRIVPGTPPSQYYLDAMRWGDAPVRGSGTLRDASRTDHRVQDERRFGARHGREMRNGTGVAGLAGNARHTLLFRTLPERVERPEPVRDLCNSAGRILRARRPRRGTLDQECGCGVSTESHARDYPGG